ncbi:MAG: hypothetical protein JRM80_07275 [Nitrososphaerota archaeon]|nr:hypothetical protein [Nitrososphaerota archaeon]
MKQSKLLALLVIISLSLIPMVPPQVSAQGSHTERIAVYVAGPNAAWFISIGAVNVTNPVIQSAEAIAGVTSYNLTAIRSTGWSTDFQIFGPQGYNVLPVPRVPPEGAFLTVGAGTFADASSAASKLGSYLLTTFRSTGNASGSYTFFAPLSFAAVVPSTLLKLVPFSDGGFLAPITAAGFLALSSPMLTLSAQKTSGGGFVHQVSIGSITTTGLDSSSRPNLLNYFGQAQASIRASNTSTSSVIDYHFLDGLVASSDNATMTTDRAAFSSTYTLTLKPGAAVTRINATVVEQPPELLATRVVDVGVLRPGTNMSVTINLTNLSNSTAVTDLKLNDSWWQSAGGFKLVRGNSFVDLSSLGAGQSASPTYVLQYTGNATGPLPVPPAPVGYSYTVGPASLRGYANLNPITLSLGADQPVVFAYVAPSSSFPTPVGGNQSLQVFVKNVGTRTANSVSVEGHQVGGLAADGGSATVALSATAPGLTRVNVTKAYSVSYTTPSGQSLNQTTNSLAIIFAQTGMRLGLGMLSLNSTVSQLAGGGYNLTLTMALANKGAADLTSFSALTALPPGLSCGERSSNLTCNGGTLALSYPLVAAGSTEHASVNFTVTQPTSFIFWPSSFSYESSGYLLTGSSNAQPAPTGLVVSKVFRPSALFPGMVSQVTALARNGGPYTIFNATLSTTADGFDSIPLNQSTVKSAQSLARSENLTLAYSATVGSYRGSPSASPATAAFFMGGTPFTISTSTPALTLSEPLAATITTSPASPVEGSPFTVNINVTNPSSVAVTDAKFFLSIPSGVTISNFTNGCNCASFQNGGLTMSVGDLAPGSSASARATISAGSGTTIPFKPGGSLTFVYANQTLGGTLPTGGIAISENVTTRYMLPIGVAVLALIVVAYEVRRMAAPTAPSSQK